MRYKQELAAVNAALGQGGIQAERDKADAARFRSLCELHDGGSTLWHVRGADGQPIAIGGLANAIDQKAEQPGRQTQSGMAWERKCSEWDEGHSAGRSELLEQQNTAASSLSEPTQ